MALDKEFFESVNIDVVKKKYYNANKVNSLLGSIQEQAETMTQENELLRKQLQALNGQKTEIGDTLLSAQALAKKIVAQAREQADSIVRQAQAKADSIVSGARERRDELLSSVPDQQEYAARCVENEILMLMRSHKKTQGDVSLNETIGTDKEGNQIMLIDVMKNDSIDIFDEINLGIQVKQLYKNLKNELDDRERKVIIMRYGLADGKCYTQKEIAKLLKISRSYVSRIEKKAVEKLGKDIRE